MLNLARALYRNTSIIIIEDWLWRLDEYWKKIVIKSAILDEYSSKTWIIVTHNLELLKRASKIVFMDKGKINSVWNYEQIKLKPIYSELKAMIEQESKQVNISMMSDSETSISKTTNVTRKIDEDLKENNPLDSNEIILNISGWKYFFLSRKLATLFTGFFVFIAFGTLLSVFNQYIIITWINDSHSKGHNRFSISFIIWFIIAIFIVNIISIAFLQIFSYNAISFLYSEILEKVLRSPIHLVFDKVCFSDLLKYFNKDLKIVHQILPSLISQLIIISTLTLFPLWAGTVWVLAIAPLVLIFIIVNILWMKNYHVANSKITSFENLSLKKIQLDTIEIVEASTYIRTFQIGAHILQAQMYKQWVLGDIILSREGVENWFKIRLHILWTLIFCCSCILFVYNYDKSYDIVLVIILLGLSQLPSYTDKLYKLVDSLLSGMQSFDRIYSLNSIAEEENENGDIELLEETKSIFCKGRIQFFSFSTKYPSSVKNAINHLNLTIRPTERVAIVGLSGSGKTTLLKSIIRLQEPGAGKIEVDLIDISTISLLKLWNIITVISDESPVFDSTLRCNIDPSNKFSDLEIISAINKAHLNPLFERCGWNLSYKIGKGGIKLSSSEKKLIVLCSCILKNNKIILIEESGKKNVSTGNLFLTNYLDNLIQKIIREEMSQSTVLTVAKHISTILDSSKVNLII